MKHNSWLGGSCTCGSNVRRADDGENSGRHSARVSSSALCLERAILLLGDHATNGSRKRGAIFHAVYFKFECFLPLPAASTINPDACLVPFGATIRYPTFVYLLPSFFDQTITTIHPLDVSSACFEHTSG